MVTNPPSSSSTPSEYSSSVHRSPVMMKPRSTETHRVGCPFTTLGRWFFYRSECKESMARAANLNSSLTELKLSRPCGGTSRRTARQFKQHYCEFNLWTLGSPGYKCLGSGRSLPHPSPRIAIPRAYHNTCGNTKHGPKCDIPPHRISKVISLLRSPVVLQA